MGTTGGGDGGKHGTKAWRGEPYFKHSGRYLASFIVDNRDRSRSRIDMAQSTQLKDDVPLSMYPAASHLHIHVRRSQIFQACVFLHLKIFFSAPTRTMVRVAPRSRSTYSKG